MSDLIDRQAAIEAILHITNCKSVRELFEYNQAHHLTEMWSGGVNDAIDAVIGVESATDKNVGSTAQLSTNLAEVGTEERAEERTKTHACDSISRQQAIDAVMECGKKIPPYAIRVKNAIEQLPPAQPEQHHDEWCTDCKEYDKERHCCPRWNKVIRHALTDIHPLQRTGKWIPSDSQCGIRCSACGAPVDDFCHSIDYIDLDYEPNFCPNCGAKMTKGDAE